MTSGTRGDVSKRSSILFFAMVLAYCAWVFSLPIFPTQDGPMHKYYVHIISELLTRLSPVHADYAFSTPLPPYLSHYTLMLGLSRIFPMAKAEELFVCVILFGLAYGLRYCALAVGRSGDLVSFCVAPLLLSFILFMGFFNYTLGIALCLFAAGIYIRAMAGKPLLWALYLLVIAVLAITHPVPLLLLLAILCLHFAIAFLQRSRVGNQPAISTYGASMFAIVATGIAFLYPVLAQDRSRAAQTFPSIQVHLRAFIHFASLTTLLPYDARSRGLPINLLRLLLYVLILGGLAIGAQGFTKRLQRRELKVSDTFLVGAIALLIAIPIIPDAVNGSFYFSSRMAIFAALAALIAAAGRETLSGRLRYAIVAFAIAGAILSIALAEHYFRPISHMLVEIEGEQLPVGRKGLLISDQHGMLGSFRRQLGVGIVDPLAWAGALPVTRNRGELLNPPWLDEPIMPLKAQPNSPMLMNDLSPEERAVMGGANDGLVLYMKAEERERLLSQSAYIVYTGTPADIAQGLQTAIGSAQAQEFSCRAPMGWYVVCLHR